MGTQVVQASRLAAIRQRLSKAALAGGIACALLLPVTPGAWSGAGSQSAGAAGFLRDAAHGLIPALVMTISRETGCCA